MPRILPSLRRLAAAFLFLHAASVAAQATDADVLAAKAAYERGDRSRLDALAPRAKGHVLESYVAWWQLKLGIDAAEPGAVRAFAKRYAGTPLAERATVEGLKALGRKGDWTRFAEFHAATADDDVELACYARQAARQREGDSALVSAKALWFTGQATPDACEAVFAGLFARGILGVDDRWARYRLALESGNVRLAQQIAGDLPSADRIDARDFARVDAKPAAELAMGAFRWKSRDGRELALYALERASRSDPDAARAGWLKWRDRFTAPERAWGNARLAYHAARQLMPWANDAWRDPIPDTIPADARAWRVRAALRAQSWRDVLAAIDALPRASAADAVWRYWRARALAATARTGEARAIYETLAVEHDYHGLLAAEALGTCVDPQSAPVAADPAWQASFGAREDVQRAVKLAQLDLRADSQREWLAIVRAFEDDALNQAAIYAAARGMHDRAINTANRTREHHDYALRYPMPWRKQFEAAARDNAVDEALLRGIARQESRFVPEIVSSAGAIGLMQLMPATARWVAKQSGRTDYTAARINDLDVNTQFGAFYFKYWLDRLDGSVALAAAAYNAGPGRAQAWRPSAAALDGAIWVETIPFNETRDYVKKVLANSVYYARAFGDASVEVRQRLGTIAPRPAGPLASAAPIPVAAKE
ncbi:MAG: transglycosylase SLT domain-containing protein [Betaproteobacteria bacterium]